MSAQLKPPTITEKAFQGQVQKLARTLGWIGYHTLNSWGSAKGFPDFVLMRPPRLIFAELKSDKGRLSPEQAYWLDSLKACGVEAYLWRPADIEDVFRVLSAREGL